MSLFNFLDRFADPLRRVTPQTGLGSLARNLGPGSPHIAPGGAAQGPRGGGLLGIEPHPRKSLEAGRNTTNSRPGYPWRDQIYRLGATLRDMSHPSGGNALEQADRMIEARTSLADDKRRMAQMGAYADETGMSPGERALFEANPELWLQLFGASRRRPAPGAATPFGPEV